MSKNRARVRAWWLAAATVAVVPWLARVTVSAQPASSSYVGSEVCADCHDDIAAAFPQTAHGRADLSGASISGTAAVQGCESCHGPGGAHADSGDPADIRVLRTASAERVESTCMTCHRGGDRAFWHASEHETAGLSCTDCHRAHAPWSDDRALVNSQRSELCLSCHSDKRKFLVQRSGHPLRTGQMTCTDCHSPHGSSASVASLVGANVNETCYRCHTEKRGPFLWEHGPVREDCLNCHNPHGSNQTKMLVASPPRLCQSCHMFGHHQTVPGTSQQVWNQNRSCLNCHPRIHGSNHPSGIVFMR